MGVSRAEDDVKALNEESDEVDGDLEVAIEEEQNCRALHISTTTDKMFEKDLSFRVK